MNSQAVSIGITLMLELLKSSAEASQLAGKAIAEQRALTADELAAVSRALDAAIADAQQAINDARGS